MKKNIENFLAINPWRSGDFSILEKDFSERSLFMQLLEWLWADDVLVIHGPRQVGKTTLIYMLMKYLINNEHVLPCDIFYYNAEDPLLTTDFFTNYLDLYNFVKQERKKRAYVFIDEAQKIENIGVFLKNIHDLRDSHIKLIITGSSTLELKQKIHEPLTGRKKVFTLYPFNFSEFIQLKKGKNSLQNWQHVEINKDLFYEFVTYGGYPKVVLSQSIAQKKAELHEIYSSYIQKDVKDFLRIENPDAFNRLLRILSDQIGNLFNVHEISNTLGINRITLEKYLKILEETFVIHRLPPFYRNPRKEITKMPKVYFIDTGLRNYISGNMTFLPDRADIGRVSENHVFTEYFKSSKDLQKLYFWRTQSKVEVDFVYFHSENKFFPIEVKSGAAPDAIPQPLRIFIETYKPKEAIIFNNSGDKNILYGDCQLWYLPLSYCGLNEVILPGSDALPQI